MVMPVWACADKLVRHARPRSATSSLARIQSVRPSVQMTALRPAKKSVGVIQSAPISRKKRSAAKSVGAAPKTQFSAVSPVRTWGPVGNTCAVGFAVTLALRLVPSALQGRMSGELPSRLNLQSYTLGFQSQIS